MDSAETVQEQNRHSARTADTMPGQSRTVLAQCGESTGTLGAKCRDWVQSAQCGDSAGQVRRQFEYCA